jgi:predicted O-methyltransferase YrrM
MNKLPERFYHFRDNTVNEARKVKGHLPVRDMRFLCLLGMVPTTTGEILEIGSFQGKSTIALAKSIEFLNNDQKLYAVDPMILSSVTDPTYQSSLPLYEEFMKNLQEHNVDSIVEFHKMKSEELGKSWNRRLRLLWIDGDHTYLEVKRDFETFLPFLNPGAIVAFHDVLNSFDGPVRVMAEQVLLSDQFGSFGFCGSIGWSQYLGNSQETQVYWKEKLKYYKKLHRLVPYVVMNRKIDGLDRYIYKLNRALIPHEEVEPTKWLNEVKIYDKSS